MKPDGIFLTGLAALLPFALYRCKVKELPMRNSSAGRFDRKDLSIF